jgi:hypothetical protein
MTTRKKPIKRSPLKRRNKFGAKPVYDIDGQRCHDSQGEARYWAHLEMLERGKVISDLIHQPLVLLIEDYPPISWRLDASFVEEGRVVYVDYKPRPITGREVLLIRLWRHFAPSILRIIAEPTRGRFTVRRTIVPNALQ